MGRYVNNYFEGKPSMYAALTDENIGPISDLAPAFASTVAEQIGFNSAAGTFNTTMTTVVNYSGGGVLQALIQWGSDGVNPNAINPELNLVVDGKTLWNGLTGVGGTNKIRCFVGTMSMPFGVGTLGYALEPGEIWFKRSLLIQHRVGTFAGPVMTAYKLIKYY